MTVRLRPHHLLCILTYVGKGYSPAFTVNMTRIAERLTSGEMIEIVEGPDDICSPLLDELDPHCNRASVTLRDRAAADDIGPVLNLNIQAGTRLTLGDGVVSRLRDSFASIGIRQACGGCEWRELCGSIAASGYQGVALQNFRSTPAEGS